MKYIIFNGPPGSGKSTAMRNVYQYLAASNYCVDEEAFAYPIKGFLSAILGVAYHDIKKDNAHPMLSGYTPREFLIHLSENYIKPRYGKDAFGRWLQARNTGENLDYVIVDDSGFEEELAAIDDKVVIRINRPGHTFANDSRKYLKRYDYIISNDGTIDDFIDKILDVVKHIIGEV